MAWHLAITAGIENDQLHCNIARKELAALNDITPEQEACSKAATILKQQNRKQAILTARLLLFAPCACLMLNIKGQTDQYKREDAKVDFKSIWFYT